jgi:hypothetical protein
MKLLSSEDAKRLLALVPAGAPEDQVEGLRELSEGDAVVIANQEKKFGCFCDLEPGMAPDGCVIDENRPDDCTSAKPLIAAGKDQWSCREWRVVQIVR